MKFTYTLQTLFALSLVISAVANDAGKKTGSDISTRVVDKTTLASDSIISPPSVITSPSSLGEVNFQHEFHYEDLEIECQTCHHEVDAVKLNIPHKEYFEDFWISCTYSLTRTTRMAPSDGTG